MDAKKIGRLFVANRDLDRAKRLASHFGGYAVPLSELEGTLPEADIIISSTAANEPIVTRLQMDAAIRLRKRKPIFAVDIAVPRDIEQAVAELDDVYLYGIDDLQQVILEGQGSREAAAVDAHKILDDEINRYTSMERAKEANPIITSLRTRGQSIRDEVAAQARRRMASGMSAEDAIEYATASMMKKMLHSPSVRLREAGEASNETIIEAARILFDLDQDDDS